MMPGDKRFFVLSQGWLSPICLTSTKKGYKGFQLGKYDAVGCCYPIFRQSIFGLWVGMDVPLFFCPDDAYVLEWAAVAVDAHEPYKTMVILLGREMQHLEFQDWIHAFAQAEVSRCDKPGGLR